MYPESDLLPISALQHLLFCPRQTALIHVERLWAENSLTREGRHLHEKADSGRSETRKQVGGGGGRGRESGSGGSVRIARGLMLRSLELGLFGKADVVEFRRAPKGPQAVPFPVEYKRGKPKKNRCDEVQLCAQALCLEEMLAVAVPAGALFYGTTRRRVDVPFDDGLRALTKRLIEDLRRMIDSGHTPPAVWEKKCKRCSLIHLCLPESRPATDAASRYLQRAVALSLAGSPVGE